MGTEEYKNREWGVGYLSNPEETPVLAAIDHKTGRPRCITAIIRAILWMIRTPNQ